jgi:hypothetical protein
VFVLCALCRHLIALFPALPTISVAVMCLYLLIAVVFHYLIHVESQHELIKASSPQFLHIILLGCDVAFLMCGIATVSQAVECRVVPTMVAVAFSAVFGALLAKTYRIHRVSGKRWKLCCCVCVCVVRVRGVSGGDGAWSLCTVIVDGFFGC